MNQPNLSVAPLAHRRPAWSKPQLLLGGTVATIALAAGSYWALQPRPSEGLLPTAATFLPENTVWALGFAVAQHNQLLALGNPRSRQVLQAQWTKLQQDLLADYQPERDIWPWVDRELYIANVSKDNNRQGLLLVLPIQRGAFSSAQVLAKLKAGTKEALSTQQIAGTTVFSSPRGHSWAVLEDVVLMSSQVRAIDQALQAHQSHQNLATSTAYQNARQDIAAANPFLRLYLNIPLAMATSQVKSDRLRQAMAVNGTIEGNVLRWRGVAWGGAKKTEPKNTPSLDQWLPGNSLWVAIGSDFQNLWQTYQPLTANNASALFQPKKLVESLKSTTGLDFQQDILSWMQGEFALASVPQSVQPPAIAPSQGSLLLLAATKDRSKAAGIMAQLDQIMANRYQYTVKNQKVGNVDTIQWLTPVGGSQSTRGWLTENLMFLNLGAPTTEQFLPKPPAKLSDSAVFQQMTRSTLQPYNLRFYIDLQGMQQAGNLSLANFPAETREVLSGVQVLGFTMANGVERDRFDLAFTVEQVADPSPSPSATAQP